MVLASLCSIARAGNAYELGVSNWWIWGEHN